MAGKMKKKSRSADLSTHTEVRVRSSKEADDRVDTDLASFIESFITGLPDAVKLEKINLSTPEDARAALDVLDKKLQTLNQQLSTARALQRAALTSRGE